MTSPSSPLSIEARRDVWWCHFDTPKSPVNIFTRPLAEAVLELTERARREGPRALIFATAKDRSFLNGAQLMMASAVQRPEDVLPLTALLRQAYQAVQDLPLLTVAAVHGTCYGCGVEFTLHCDRRIATDAGHTHFYMTELVDYLDTPAFGSTQLLPKLMTLSDSVDFLMWGRRLHAPDALSTGLVDRILPHHDLSSSLTELLSDPDFTTLTRPTPGTGAHTINELRTAIDHLPEPFRHLHDQCLTLLHRGHQSPTVSPDDRRAELDVCGHTLINPIASKARSVFFLRQLAQRATLRHAPPPQPIDLLVPPDLLHHNPHSFLARLATHGPPHLRLLTDPDHARPDALKIPLLPPTSPPSSSATLRQHSGFSAHTPGLTWHEPTPGHRHFSHLHRPHGGATAVIELAIHDPEPDPAAQHLFALLTDLDATVLLSRPHSAFATDSLLLAYLRPLLSFLTHGGSTADLHTTLLDFGFLLPPSEIATYLAPDTLPPNERPALEKLTSSLPTSEGEIQPFLIDQILLELIYSSAQLLKNKVLPHRSVADIAITDLIGFPIHHGTLGQFFTLQRARTILDRLQSSPHHTPEPVWAHAQRFLHEEVELYG